ncbi:MAG: fumarylacetoacetate (FAA) hydrolase [Bradymonadia bacterium]|jgi:fumarylacetoacetate (FAA) hydrolase
MKLATLDNGTRDGALLIVSRDGAWCADATDIAPTMQAALDAWDKLSPRLRTRYDRLNEGSAPGRERLDVAKLHSPLPRAYEWIDGSAYINHIVLVRKARNAEPPATLKTDPLVYQGGSGVFLRPTQDITFPNTDGGIDFEAEIAVVMGDTPRGTTQEEAGQHVRLLMLVNDVTLRSLIPPELAKSFGFFVSKPSTAFSPFAITPDELGDAWNGGRVHLPLKTTYNGKLYGDPDSGPEMHFSFFDLIKHVTQTRALTAGTIIGSGTVSNDDVSRGSSCLAEQRMIEKIETGEFKTPFMDFGDTVQIDMHDADGVNLFGTISQKVAKSDR